MERGNHSRNPGQGGPLLPTPPPPPGSSQPPKKKRRIQPTMTVTSGVRADPLKFQWRIENFGAIRHSRKMLQAQQFTVELGASVGVPCKWTFSLNSETEIVPAPPTVLNQQGGGNDDVVPLNMPLNIEWLEIVRKLVETPPNVEDISNSCSLKIKDKDRKTFFKGYGNVNCLKLNGYRTFKKVLKLTDKSTDFPLVDGALVIDFTVTTFASREITFENASAVSHFDAKASAKLSDDLIMMLASNGQSTFADIKIISKDGKEFSVHKSILAARNPVFQAMFASNLSEHQSGVVRVEDIGGKALDILLRYIYGGVVNEEWFESDVIVELTYGAGKYQLTEVLEFLDNVLGIRGQGENAGALLALAEKLHLPKAEKELMNYVKSQAIPAAKSYSDLQAILLNNLGG